MLLAQLSYLIAQKWPHEDEIGGVATIAHDWLNEETRVKSAIFDRQYLVQYGLPKLIR